MSRRPRLAPVLAGVVLVVVLVAAAWWWFGRSTSPAVEAGGSAATAGGDGLRLAVELYFPGPRTSLGRERRELAVTDDPRQQLRALGRALMDGPSNPSLFPPMPPGVTLRAVSLGDGGVVYVDLVSEDGSPPPAGGTTEERLRVYSLVNSLVLNVAEARSAVLLWNGSQPETFMGHLDLSRPLVPDPSLVARPADDEEAR